MSRIGLFECFDHDDEEFTYNEEFPPPATKSSPHISFDPYFDSSPPSTPPLSTNRRVTTRKSHHLKCFYQHIPVDVCMNTWSRIRSVQ